MRSFTPAVLLCCLFASVASSASASASAAAARPNVLLLMTDEHTANVLGCYGDPLVKTPTLDGLAAKGVRFTAAYCQNPICVPSRVTLVSGRMPCHLKTFGNTENQTYKDVTTLADVFTQAGYQASWFGKTHWGEPRFQPWEEGGKKPKKPQGEDDEKMSRLPQDSRVSDWPVEQNPEHVTAEKAIRFLSAHQDKPFFLGVSFSKPHFPYTIQQKYYDLYKDKVKEPRANEELIHDLPELQKVEREKYGFAGATATDISRTRALYYGMVTYVDEEFGRILGKLDELGLRENTIVLYTVDHGEMLGDRGIWYKNAFFDGAARIPFIWSYPRQLPTNRVSNVPVMNIDVLPTLCELCELPAPKGLEGGSLVSLMKNGDAGVERYALCENYRSGFSGRMIRTNDWKYFFYTNGDERLYDMKNDPGEEKDLSKDPAHRELVAKLKARASEGWVQPPKAKVEKQKAKEKKFGEKKKKA